MNAMRALRQYQSVNVNAQVMDASPHRLIQLLINGGLDRIAQARGALERDQQGLKGELIGKAIGIVGGLRAGLNLEQGGELASNLDALYEYMSKRLLEANQHNDLQALDEVAQLLRKVKEGWDGIAGQVAA